MTQATVLVTGAAGFIGSNFVRLALKDRPSWRIVAADALTYAGNLENLAGLEEAHPERFHNERFGKDEAYYFLPGPKGPWPYTHVGFYPDVTERDLLAAMAAGREALLELSPHFLARPGTGFFVPAGLVHSPGTTLTLEVQQPSDVGGGFGFRLPPTASPADRDAEAKKVFEQIDLDLCRAPDLLSRCTLLPKAIEVVTKGISQWWIMPPDVTRKFSAKRVVFTEACIWQEPGCFALYIWAGQGRICGHDVVPGREFFVPDPTAAVGLQVEPAAQGLEVFAVFAEAV